MASNQARPAGEVENTETWTGAVLGRRRFLTSLLAAPSLTLAARWGLDPAQGPGRLDRPIPSPPSVESQYDITQAVCDASRPTMGLVVLEVGQDGRARLELPRVELGQGITTATAMLVAEDLDLPVSSVDVVLSDSRPELVFNQLTGGSSSIRAFYEPLRVLAATARRRLLAAAAVRWGVPVGSLSTRNGVVVAPDGRTAPYGALSAAAAKVSLPPGAVAPKPESQQTVLGRPTRRVDGRAIVTGQKKFTMDLAVLGAKPTMLRRPPTILGPVHAVHNAAAVERMPGVVGVTVIPTGVAVMADTFEQARAGVNALDVTFGPGPVATESNSTIMQTLRDAVPPLAPPPLGSVVIDAEFEWAPATHASMETESAIADVRPDGVEVWTGSQAPIWAHEEIAKALGLPLNRVTVHVVPAGGGFGRRCFYDAAMEAVQVSKALGRPAKVMWHRTDDMRHARMRPPVCHRIRASLLGGQVVSYEQRAAGVLTDFGHGFGEILLATVNYFPDAGVRRAIGNDALEEALFTTFVSSPYNFGAQHKELVPVHMGMRTSSYRAIPCPMARGSEEIVVDEIAAALRKDPVQFRREVLKSDRGRAVLDRVAQVGQWGRAMPRGFAQGVGYHEESRACTACIVEMDARDPRAPRVTRATMAVDVGRPINPLGLEAQMQGCLAEAVSLTLRAGLHIKDGLPLEGSYADYHWARQKDYPTVVQVIVMPANGGPLAGAGEVGIGAATGAIANAYARATGIKPRSFPLVFPVDFEPFAPGTLPPPPYM